MIAAGDLLQEGGFPLSCGPWPGAARSHGESMMSESKTSTVSMKGGGYYSQHTRGAKDVIDNTAALAIDALGAIDLEAQATPFSIADFGSADGGTSVDLVRKLIEGVRERAPARPITVTYTDLPRNDFSAIFTMVHGGRADIRSYLDDFDDVYVFASGTSFYQPIFPEATLDLGFSATAMHWLSRLPGDITDHVQAVGAHGRELETFREHAMRDWETILVHRARELKPGGRLVMSNFCIDEQGRYLGNTDGVNMFDTFNALWRAMVDAGRITEEEYQRTAFPQFYKTVDEYCRPLTDPASRVHAAGLRLESAETRIVRCPYRAAFESHGDVDRFATEYVPTLRSWSETVFFNSLDSSRPSEERQAIVDEYYRSYVDLVRRAPDGHAMDYVHVYMVVSKIPN